MSVLVRDYLEQEGLTAEQLAEQLELAVSTVERRVMADQDTDRATMPPRWRRKLGLELDDDGSVQTEPGDGRATETPPSRPDRARVRETKPAAAMDLSTFAGYVEGAYTLAGHTIGMSDPALGQTLESYAKQAGEAWAKWVESEPKVRALLERMMVGTPLGEVVGVHVAIAFSYFLARKEMRRLIEQQAAADVQERQQQAAG